MPAGLSPRALAKFAMAQLVEAAGPRPQVVVAFSGGLDSTALAHMLVDGRRQLGGLRLVHVDHGLQASSGDWRRHCARLARNWRVPFRSTTARVKTQRGESIEAAAREARYALLERELDPGEVLVTAQHQDDQAETLLLQLIRGAGVTGLAAMPRSAPFGQGTLVRPLLDRTRAELAQYAQQHGLQWVEDPTNQLQRFARNFLRHRVMPLLRARWPSVGSSIARSARHMSEAMSLLDEIARRDLIAVADGDGLNVAALRRLAAPRRRNVLRAFIARAGLELPPTVQLNEIAGSLLMARKDAQPAVSGHGYTVARRSGRLLLDVKPQKSPSPAPEMTLKSWRWKDQREFILNDRGERMALIEDPAGSVDLDRLPESLELRTRRGGESLRPGPRARTQSLKKLMQAAKLTVEQRARLPLWFAGDGPKGRLIAAGDRWLDSSVMANVKSRRRARLVWESGD